MAGFEPAASCSQSRRANQAALHPVLLTAAATSRRPASLSHFVRRATAVLLDLTVAPPQARMQRPEPGTILAVSFLVNPRRSDGGRSAGDRSLDLWYMTHPANPTYETGQVMLTWPGSGTDN